MSNVPRLLVYPKKVMLHKNRCWWDMETIIDFGDQWIRNILNEIKTKNSRKVSPSFIKWLFEQVFRLPSKFCICFKGNSTIAFHSLWSFQDFILNDLNPNLMNEYFSVLQIELTERTIIKFIPELQSLETKA